MTTKTPPKLDWQQELIHAVTDPSELCRLLDLNPEVLTLAGKALTSFPMKVPRGFVARMEKGNPKDPLLLQVLPLSAEDQFTKGYSADPLGEEKVNPVPGLLHKYRGRVLLTLTGICAVNCRYCFRRHFPYSENNPSQQDWKAAFDYIQADPSISEVILSGGDPLLWNDRRLQSISEQLNSLPAVKRLRIHSRIPIVLPERITDELVAWFRDLKQQAVLVTHSNHPREINGAVIEAMQRLKSVGVTLLNQAVLLKGVNDELSTQIALSEALFKAGILPYYLHLLDRVQGTAHFEVDLKRAKKLYRELSHHLPGYLLPKFSQEIAGLAAKQLIAN